MPRHYGSFLVRCWRLSNGERRIEIEHIASGARARVSSIAAALEWIGTQIGDSLTDRQAGAAPGDRSAEDAGGTAGSGHGHTP